MDYSSVASSTSGNSSKRWFCTICQMFLNGTISIIAHTQGKKHVTKLSYHQHDGESIIIKLSESVLAQSIAGRSFEWKRGNKKAKKQFKNAQRAKAKQQLKIDKDNENRNLKNLTEALKKENENLKKECHKLTVTPELHQDKTSESPPTPRLQLILDAVSCLSANPKRTEQVFVSKFQRGQRQNNILRCTFCNVQSESEILCQIHQLSCHPVETAASQMLIGRENDQ